VGYLTNWDFPPSFTDRFPIIVETGYGGGHGLTHAASYPFRKIISLEIVPELAAQGRLRHAPDDRVTVYTGESPYLLSQLLPALGGGIFFWLDAHFPGFDFGAPFQGEIDEAVQRPLFQELEVIRANINPGKYALLIDDLTLFWNEGPWEKSIRDEWGCMLAPKQGLGFLDPFLETHTVTAYANNLGCAWVLPRGAPAPAWVE